MGVLSDHFTVEKGSRKERETDRRGGAETGKRGKGTEGRMETERRGEGATEIE